jgi:hypothetical protein
MVEIDAEPRHIQYTSSAWYNHPAEEVDFWRVDYYGRTYDAKTAEQALEKAHKDPRNDPHSIKRVTNNIASMRTLYSQAVHAQSMLRYSDDLEHDDMLIAVEACVKLLEPWRRQLWNSTIRAACCCHGTQKPEILRFLKAGSYFSLWRFGAI